MHYNWLSPSIFFALPLDIGDIVMMRKCMLGIKRRAEQASRLTARPDGDPAWQTLLAFRIGYSTHEGLRSPRLSVDEVVK